MGKPNTYNPPVDPAYMFLVPATPQKNAAVPPKPPKPLSPASVIRDPINAVALANTKPIAAPDPVKPAPAEPTPKPPTDQPKKSTYFSDTAPFYEKPVVSFDPALAGYAWYNYDADTAADSAGYEKKLKDFLTNANIIKKSLKNRYTESYYDTYHGDTAAYASDFSNIQDKLSNTSSSLLNDIESLRGTFGDEWANKAVNTVMSVMNDMNRYAALVQEDADYWTPYKNEADYGAAMFNADMTKQYTGSTFSDIQDEISNNNGQLSSIFAPADLINGKMHENIWLNNYADTVATGDDYRKQLDAAQKQLDEDWNQYNPGDSASAKNRSIGIEIGKLNKDILALKNKAYNADMRRMVGLLPKDLQDGLMQIPFLTDDIVKAGADYDLGYTDAKLSNQISNDITAKINTIKDELQEHGFTDGEIDDLITYATRNHDIIQFEKYIKEKEAYAKEHPVGASIDSVFENFLGILDPLDTLAQGIGSFVTGKDVPINDYTGAKQFSAGADATRDTVADMIKDSTGSDFLGGLYKGGMTAVDLLAQAAIPGAGLGFADDAARGLVKATTKADDILALLGITGKNGDDVLKAIANTAGKSNDDIIKAIADSTGKSAEEVARIIANGTAANGDNAARMLASATAKNGTVPGSVAGQAVNTGDDYFNSWIDYLKGNIKNPDIEDVNKLIDDTPPPKTNNPLDPTMSKGYNENGNFAFEKGSNISKEILETKPLNSPTADKWLNNGGKIEIDNGTWRYTNPEGISVTYPNGYPDFKGSGLVYQEVDIGTFRYRNADFNLADELAPLGPKSPNNTWHHHENGMILQEVDKFIHKDFTHRGGISLMKRQ